MLIHLMHILPPGQNLGIRLFHLPLHFLSLLTPIQKALDQTRRIRRCLSLCSGPKSPCQQPLVVVQRGRLSERTGSVDEVSMHCHGCADGSLLNERVSGAWSRVRSGRASSPYDFDDDGGRVGFPEITAPAGLFAKSPNSKIPRVLPTSQQISACHRNQYPSNGSEIQNPRPPRIHPGSSLRPSSPHPPLQPLSSPVGFLRPRDVYLVTCKGLTIRTARHSLRRPPS